MSSGVVNVYIIDCIIGSNEQSKKNNLKKIAKEKLLRLHRKNTQGREKLDQLIQQQKVMPYKNIGKG